MCIVDYNHVQSALNFQFMKRMNQVGIPIIFINQIDKHNENEISFDTFKQKVEQSIQDWDIKVDQLFYVSMLVNLIIQTINFIYSQRF